jgi:hypothetical protein
MGYALLWIGALATAAVWCAAETAWSARRRRRWAQVGWAVAAGAALPVALGALASVGAGYVAFVLRIQPDWFWYCLSWTVLLAVIVAGIVVRGLRRVGPGEPEPAARRWPTGRLGAMCAVGAVLVCLTMVTMDMTVKAQMSSLQAEADALAASVRVARPPDRENAMAVYEEAFEALRSADSASAKAWQEVVKRWSDQPEIRADDPELADFLEAPIGQRHPGPRRTLPRRPR